MTKVRADAQAWFAKALAEVTAAGVAGDAFARAWSGAGRRLGREVVVVEVTEGEALVARSVPFLPNGWGADEIGRGVLLLTAAEGRSAEEVAGVVDGLFRLGEMREQQAVLRVLGYLPEPARYRALAADAVRINVLSVIEALACENPYPARFMPELAFNQMIMKAIFNELPLSRVIGLSDRNNAELRRMVTAYASERRAAGRPVPADVDLVLAS